MDLQKSRHVARVFEPDLPDSGFGSLAVPVETILTAAETKRKQATDLIPSAEEAIAETILRGASGLEAWERSRRFFGAAAIAASNIESRQLDYKVVDGLVGGLAEAILHNEPYEENSQLKDEDQLKRFDDLIRLLAKTYDYEPLRRTGTIVAQAQEKHLQYLRQMRSRIPHEKIWEHAGWIGITKSPIRSYARREAIEAALLASEQALRETEDMGVEVYTISPEDYFSGLLRLGDEITDPGLFNKVVRAAMHRLDLMYPLEDVARDEEVEDEFDEDDEPAEEQLFVQDILEDDGPAEEFLSFGSGGSSRFDRFFPQSHLDNLLSSKIAVLTASGAGLVTLGQYLNEMAENKTTLPRRLYFILSASRSLGRDKKELGESDSKNKKTDEGPSFESIERAQTFLHDWLSQEIQTIKELNNPVVFTAIFDKIKSRGPKRDQGEIAHALREFTALISDPEVLPIGLAAIEQVLDSWQRELDEKSREAAEDFAVRREKIKKLSPNILRLVISKGAREDRQEALFSASCLSDDQIAEAVDQRDEKARINATVASIGQMIGDKITFLAATVQGRESVEIFINEWLSGFNSIRQYIGKSAAHAVESDRINDQEAKIFLKNLISDQT